MKTSQLDAIVNSIARKGVRLSPNVPGGFVIGAGCLLLLIAAWIMTSSALELIAPARATWFPRCPGNATINFIPMAVMTAIATALIPIGLAKCDIILLSDTEINFVLRSGKRHSVAWYEVTEAVNILGNFQLIGRNSRSWFLAPALSINRQWRFDFVLSLALLVAPHISKTNPSLSKAFAAIKTKLVGPGITFPFCNPMRHENISRTVHGGLFLLFAAGFFAFFGILGKSGPGLGLVPIVLSPLMLWAIRRKHRAFDLVNISMKGISITRGETTLEPIAIEGIKSTMSTSDGLHITCRDKTKSITLYLDWRSARLLSEFIKIAKHLPGLSVVPGKQATKKAA